MKATLDFRDDLIDKEVAEKLSKEVTSYIIEQVKNNMKTIEERAKEYSKGQWDEPTANKAYIDGAKEQKAIDEEATLKGFTTDELRAELKKRNAEEKAKKASILRCRMCKHWGEIDYQGNPTNYNVGDNLPCKFFKTKNGKHYRCHSASQLACEHFERKE